MKTIQTRHETTSAPPKMALDAMIADLEAHLKSLDDLRLEFIKARRKCIDERPAAPGALEYPIKLGDKLLWPRGAEEDRWSVEALRELALNEVKFEGYRLGKTGDEAKALFEVPLDTRREADAVLSVVIEYQKQCRFAMMDAASAEEDLRNARFRVIAQLDALWNFDSDDAAELAKIGAITTAVRSHREMEPLFRRMDD